MICNRLLTIARLLLSAVGVTLLFALVGCGDEEIPRYDLSGAVLYDGQPVPVGYMTFQPDEAAGNRGPATQADIRDGRFATQPGQGTIGGPHVVTIFGFDGKPIAEPNNPAGRPMGTPIISGLQRQADLPRQSAVHDFALERE